MTKKLIIYLKTMLIQTYLGFKISLDNILKKFIIRTFKSKEGDLKLITVMFAPSLKRNK